MFRVALVVGFLTLGGILGGFYGIFLVLILCGVIGAMIGPPAPRQARPAPPAKMPTDERTEARRGKRVDPTAPSIQEEWSGALQNLKRRQ